jgi:transcriptional regulator GlxA family with amidase domain
MNYAKIEKAIKYIDEHYAEMKSIRQVADYVDMSYEYFLRSFRSAVGISPKKYLDTVRVQKAHEYILMTPYKCYSIALLAGLENENALYRLFKRMGYKNPRHYRSGS